MVPSPLAVPWPAPARGSSSAFPDPSPRAQWIQEQAGTQPPFPTAAGLAVPGLCPQSACHLQSGHSTALLRGGQSPGQQMPTLGNHPRSPALGHRVPQHRRLCVRSAVQYKARRERLLNIKRRVIPGQKHKRDGVKIGFSPGEKNCLAPVSIHKTRLVLI